MALTMTVKPLANAVAGTDFIVAILDSQGAVTAHDYAIVTYTVGASLPALGASNYTINAPFTQNAANPKLPQLQALSAVSNSDGTNTELGMLLATLAPDPADVVNASSPQVFRFSPNAIAITATTSN